MTCRCHADPVYAGLVDCPKCHHRSYDPLAEACERHACGYEVEKPRPQLFICGDYKLTRGQQP